MIGPVNIDVVDDLKEMPAGMAGMRPKGFGKFTEPHFGVRHKVWQMPVTEKAFGFSAGRQCRPKMPAGVGSGTEL